jgi:hypothetical protein
MLMGIALLLGAATWILADIAYQASLAALVTGMSIAVAIIAVIFCVA